MEMVEEYEIQKAKNTRSFRTNVLSFSMGFLVFLTSDGCMVIYNHLNQPKWNNSDKLFRTCWKF
jgi:tryptophan-rich sensory protein